jgi:putative ABC transport system substrate-binding protein
MGGTAVKRREFISLLGGAAAGWPLAGRAQQAAMPVIGFLNAGARDVFEPRLGAFWKGLGENGYMEGRNVAIEYRWANGQFDRLSAMAADLVARGVTAIATFGPPAALAAKAATSTIPIVFVTGSDPIQAGLVASLNRPGGNVTGIFLLLIGLEGKRPGLLRDLLPQATLIGLLINPRSPDAQAQSNALHAAADAVGQQLVVVNAANDDELGAAFAALVQRRAAALVVAADIFFNSRRERIVALAARHAIPAIYELSEYAAVGGLMSYGTDVFDAYYQNGVYLGRTLKGAKAGDLPVMQSVKFELVINQRTARMLGLSVPPALLAIADEVIE